jgi:hypothetical protein
VNTHAHPHLTEEDILRIVAAGPSPEDPAVRHATACPPCRARLAELTDDLTHLRRTAAASVPPAPAFIRLPAPHERAASGGMSRLGGRLAWTAALVLVAVLATWRSVSPPETPRVAVPALTAFQEEPLMKEIRHLTENALPDVYRELSADLDRDFDEDFMDFVIPPLDDPSVS